MSRRHAFFPHGLLLLPALAILSAAVLFPASGWAHGEIAGAGENRVERVIESKSGKYHVEFMVSPGMPVSGENANGELHIKYSHLRGSPTFTVKLATGFYRNPERGLPSGNGCMLVFDASTGALLMLLEDEGWLTELRTGLAGAIAARACGMTNPHRIGIIGTGVQARFQLRCLSLVSPCRSAMVFGRSPERTARYIADMEQDGFEVVAASSIAELARQCDLLVTTTNSHTPLLHANDLRLGMHVTAMGADGGGKNELDPHIYDHAGLCVVDSLSQASAFGDTSFALQRGCVSRSRSVSAAAPCR
jgi:ornithine cyclodeaminase